MFPLRLCFAASLCATLPLAAQAPDEQWLGELLNDHFGSVVEVVGDCDNDGVLDLAIASPDADFKLLIVVQDLGHVQIRSGATGDVLYNWWGSEVDGLFGYAVSNAGDIDEDGHDDVLIGMPNGSGPLGEEGLVQVRSGATGGVLRTHYGPQRFSRFGHSLAGNADLSAFDNVPDYAVGAPFHDLDDSAGGFGQEGRVFVYSGSSGALSRVFSGGFRELLSSTPGHITHTAELQHFGWSIDSNLSRLIVGAPYTDRLNVSTLEVNTNVGAAVYLKNVAGGFVESISSVLTGPGGRMGAVVSMGSLMPNGERAVVIGAPGVNQYGLVFLSIPMLPGAGFKSGPWEFTAHYGSSTAPIGEVAAFVGDVNGDGLEDYAAGSPLADFGAPFTVTDAGHVKLRSGADATLISQFGSGSAGDRFGASVAGADLDGDGAPELIVGVTHDDASTFDVGAAWFYAGEPCPAGSAAYGTGWPGTTGVPLLTAATPPKLGESFQLYVGNSAGASTQAWLFLGFSPASIPFKDGTLLVNAFTIQSLSISVNGNSILPTLPDDDVLCGLSGYLQSLVIDPGATRGVAFSRGLELQLGH